MNNSMLLQPDNKKIVDMNGNVLTVDGADAANLQLHNTFSSVRNVTASCFAIQRTIFGEVTPKPAWYDGLYKKFSDVKDLADTWNKNYAVAVTATIPSSIITFVPMFNSSSDVITDIISRSGGKLTPEHISTISYLLRKMITKVDDTSKKVNRYAHIDDVTGNSVGLLIDWQADMQSASNKLAEGSDTVQAAVSTLSTSIVDLRNEITTLNSEIEFYNKLVSTGAGMVGGGAFVTTVGAALCVAFPITAGITIFVGVGSMIAGASLWGVYQGKINDANKRISACMADIKSDYKSIAAINALASSCVSVVNYANIATENISKFSSSWVNLGESLKATLQSLENAEGQSSQSGKNVLLEMGDANKQWNTVEKYANQLLEAPSTVQVVNASQLNTVA